MMFGWKYFLQGHRDYFSDSYFLLFCCFSRYRCLSKTTVGDSYRLVKSQTYNRRAISTLPKSKANSTTKRYKKDFEVLLNVIFPGFGRFPFPVSLWLLIFLRFIRILAHMPL